MTASDKHAADPLEARVVELETRLVFQEHTLLELSDALAELRAEAARSADREKRERRAFMGCLDAKRT
jgi:SlyX protein